MVVEAKNHFKAQFIITDNSHSVTQQRMNIEIWHHKINAARPECMNKSMLFFEIMPPLYGLVEWLVVCEGEA